MNDVAPTSRTPARIANTSQVKIPPHSVDAEQSVLGGLMLDNRSWDQVADRLKEHDFYRLEHRIIFRVIAHLITQNKPVDVLTVSESLRERQELE